MNDEEPETPELHEFALRIIWPTLRAGQFAEGIPLRTNRMQTTGTRQGLAAIAPTLTRKPE
jgi:hypothetical protein